MDTLQVEHFYQGFEADIHTIVRDLKSKKEWFFTIEPVPDEPGSFVAKDDHGRYIGISSGAGPRRFSSDSAALKVALHYNNDMLKIRMSAGLSWRKDGKLNRGLM